MPELTVDQLKELINLLLSISAGLFALMAGLGITLLKRAENGIHVKLDENKSLAIKSLDRLADHVEKFHTGD